MEDALLKKTLELDDQLHKLFGERNSVLQEVFSIKNPDELKKDLVQFLRTEFEKGYLQAVHQGISTTEYKPNDWYEDMADNLVNRIIQYFEVTKGQTERDL